jgi:hypothetical protein
VHTTKTPAATTAQRHLNSEVVRDALGIDPDNIMFTVPVEEFQKLETFISDLKGDKVNSPNNKAHRPSQGTARRMRIVG